jgi:DNA modification methylase
MDAFDSAASPRPDEFAFPDWSFADGSALLLGDASQRLARLPAGLAHTCVTSPPYFLLRDYGVAGQIGLEESLDAYVARLVEVFRGVRRVLRDDGTLWLNIGDSYATNRPEGGAKPKDLLGIPWTLALALRNDGWYLRSDVIWHKPNPMPENCRDRPTKAHEYLFLLSKQPKYYYDQKAAAEPAKNEAKKSGAFHTGILKGDARATTLGAARETRNRRTVWTIASRPYRGAHFATYPPALVEPCILAGCPEGGLVLDPFIGSGTTAVVARSLGRRCIGIDLNPDYLKIARERIEAAKP